MFLIIVFNPHRQSVPAAPALQPPPHPAAPGPIVAPPLGLEDPAPSRDTQEYRTALELELWKEEQEDLFDDQVNTAETYK